MAKILGVHKVAQIVYGPVCTTSSTGVSSSLPTFTTFNNSPTLTIIPFVSGLFRIYCGANTYDNIENNATYTRIVNTSGGATLVSQNEHATDGTVYVPIRLEAIYTLVAGVTYTFDLQGATDGGGNAVFIRGDLRPFKIIAEQIL